MAIATLDFLISPADGWVKVADDPAYLFIKPGLGVPWFLAVTASGAPATAWTAASLALTFTNQPTSGQTVTLDGRVYTVLTAYDPDEPEADAFLLGANAEGTIDNLVEVVNGRAELAAAAATGTITLSGLPTATDTLVVGEDTYTFVASASVAFDVEIGADEDETGDNLALAINNDGTSGFTAENAAGVVTVTADEAGPDGNAIVLTEDADNTAVSGAGTLTGGRNAVAEVEAHATIYATKSSSSVATFTAISAGTDGNSIPVAETLSNATFAGGGTVLASGANPAVGLAMKGPPENPREAYSKVGATTGEFYVRVAEGAQAEPRQAVQFGVIRDQA